MLAYRPTIEEVLEAAKSRKITLSVDTFGNLEIGELDNDTFWEIAKELNIEIVSKDEFDAAKDSAWQEFYDDLQEEGSKANLKMQGFLKEAKEEIKHLKSERLMLQNALGLERKKTGCKNPSPDAPFEPEEKKLEPVASWKVDENRHRIDILFGAKPKAEILEYLKSKKFGWNPKTKAWYNKDTPDNRTAALRALEMAK